MKGRCKYLIAPKDVLNHFTSNSYCGLIKKNCGGGEKYEICEDYYECEDHNICEDEENNDEYRKIMKEKYPHIYKLERYSDEETKD